MTSARHITNWAQVKLVLDLNEVAFLLGMSNEKARRLCRDKKIPAFKLGSEWRVEKNKLMDFMNGNYTPPSEVQAGKEQE